MRSSVCLLTGLGALLAGGCPMVAEVTVPGARVTTSHGEFVIALDDENAPATVANFVARAAEGYYNEVVFHRVVPGTLIQAGAWKLGLLPKDTRAPIANEAGNGLMNLRGTVAMARTEDPDSATAQFFVNLTDNPELDAGDGQAGYAVLGWVAAGLDVIDAIAALPTADRDGLSDVPMTDVFVTSTARMTVAVDGMDVVGARFETTLGGFTIALNAGAAPLSVANFLQYVDDGFYVGTLFHRVIPGFVVQGGGLVRTWVTQDAGAPIRNESSPDRKNRRGTVAMAFDEGPSSASTQFFVNVTDNPDLDAPAPGLGHAVFGHVVSGLDIVDRVAALSTGQRGLLSDAPLEDAVIISVTAIEIPTGQLALTPQGEEYAQYRSYQTRVVARNLLVEALGLAIYRP